MKRQDTRIHDQLVSFKPLNKYSFGQRLAIRAADLGLYWLIRLVRSTIRFEETEGWSGLDIEGWEDFETAYARMPNTINAFWHNRLFLMTKFSMDFDAGIIVSESFDGEYIARTAQRLGFPVVRGSSTRGGSKALKQMVRLVRDGLRMGFTIDGPRGPRYRVKPGALMLAAKTGVPVLPLVPEAKSYWELSSWDRLQIPRPFTRAKMFIGEPVFVSPEAGRDELKEKKEELQRKLDELTERGRGWRETK
ncbi:MAG: lysophospholipid acyltransferase family protein [Acidobacteriota bacterium]|nr:MAG: lysophospholipid acyltransferase family protein [Acidobacteriota bacterium]